MPLLLSLGQAVQTQFNKQFHLLNSTGFYKTNMTFILASTLRSEADRVAAALARGPEKFTRCLNNFVCRVSWFHQFASLVAVVMSTAPPQSGAFDDLWLFLVMLQKQQRPPCWIIVCRGSSRFGTGLKQQILCLALQPKPSLLRFPSLLSQAATWQSSGMGVCSIIVCSMRVYIGK